jgi:hypothetical protein
VLAILRERGAERVVKSKSMLTEECGLNRHLESRGIEVVDTDLGERIVQLRREPPSHIVLPAIHLRKREIGDLFAERLGSEPARRPAAWRGGPAPPARAPSSGRRRASPARTSPWRTRAAIVICTNEGNADLGMALPPLHVACIGIEKLLPRAPRTSGCLRLLACGDGQAITPTAPTCTARGPAASSTSRWRQRAQPCWRTPARRRASPASAAARLNTCPVHRRSGGHSYGTPVAGPIGWCCPARDPRAIAACRPLSLCGSRRDVSGGDRSSGTARDLRGTLRSAGDVRRRLAGARAAAVLRAAGALRRRGALARRPALPPRRGGALGGGASARGRACRRRAARSGGAVAGSRDAILAAVARARRARRAASAGRRPRARARRRRSPSRRPSRRPAAAAACGGFGGLEAALGAPAYAGVTLAHSALPGLRRANVERRRSRPRDLDGLDFAVLPGAFGVAESGAVWVDGAALPARAALWLAEHVAWSWPAAALVDDLHAAYARLRFAGPGFGLLRRGPSKTADIERRS